MIAEQARLAAMENQVKAQEMRLAAAQVCQKKKKKKEEEEEEEGKWKMENGIMEWQW